MSETTIPKPSFGRTRASAAVADAMISRRTFATLALSIALAATGLTAPAHAQASQPRFAKARRAKAARMDLALAKEKAAAVARHKPKYLKAIRVPNDTMRSLVWNTSNAYASCGKGGQARFGKHVVRCDIEVRYRTSGAEPWKIASTSACPAIKHGQAVYFQARTIAAVLRDCDYVSLHPRPCYASAYVDYLQAGEWSSVKTWKNTTGKTIRIALL